MKLLPGYFKRKTTFIFLVKLSLSFVFLGTLCAQTIDKIVAVVNEEVITQSDVQRVLATLATEYSSVYTTPQELEQKLIQAQENIINQMVEEKLILSEAKRLDIKPDEDKIKTRIEQIKEKFANEEEFEMALELQGLTLRDLHDRFNNQEIMRQAVDYFVRLEIKIEPQEIKQFYQSQGLELTRPERVRLKSIFIKVDENQDESASLQKAKQILEELKMRLKKGDTFEDLAREYSQAANAQEGGDMGFIAKGELIKEIDDVVFKLALGEFTGVIKTQSGYHIFKVVDKKPPEPLSFSEAQDTIRDILYKKKFSEIFKKWLDELRENAYISIKE